MHLILCSRNLNKSTCHNDQVRYAKERILLLECADANHLFWRFAHISDTYAQGDQETKSKFAPVPGTWLNASRGKVA